MTTCDVCGRTITAALDAIPFVLPRNQGIAFISEHGTLPSPQSRYGVACSMACVRRSRALMAPPDDPYRQGYGRPPEFVTDDWLAEPGPPEPTPAEQREWLVENFGRQNMLPPAIERALYARLSGIVLP